MSIEVLTSIQSKIQLKHKQYRLSHDISQVMEVATYVDMLIFHKTPLFWNLHNIGTLLNGYMSSIQESPQALRREQNLHEGSIEALLADNERQGPLDQGCLGFEHG